VYNHASIVIGTTLFHFQITAKLGEGGMGEVYRAEDSKLGREVAIKVLPETVAQDPERLARFEREARLLASLNHPNIAAIYSFESADAEGTEEPVHFLVMELVEGEDLKERLERGPVAVDEARAIALQVAGALEVAHQQGIIHRDLKPANIKVTPEGQVKILDFGLAKAFDPSSGGSSDQISVSLSPTLTAQMTQAGVLLGTAAYMAPEQARGQEVDKQADIWAFGAVLFEMLTARIAFPGATVTDVIAAVVSHEPDWDALPEATPANLRETIKLCLTKDARERIHDIGDARLLLTRSLAPETETGPVETTPAWQRWLPWGVAAVLAVLAGYLALSPVTPPTGDRPVRQLSITLPPDIHVAPNEPLAISRDGSKIVFSGMRYGSQQLFLRSLESTAVEALSDTEDGQNAFFSPDGEAIGFTTDAGGKMLALSLATGRARVIADGAWGGGSWGLDDVIVYTPTYTDGLYRVAAGGGATEELTRPDLENGELGHFWPQHLPGGKKVLFTVFSVPLNRSSIQVLDLESGDSELVIEDGVWGRYSPTGHLLFVRDQTLMAVGLDPTGPTVVGAPIPVLEDVIPDIGQGDTPVVFSENGTLAFVPGAVMRPPRQLVWIDRQGRETPIAERRRYGSPRVSPDGSRIALTIADKSWDLWALELDRGTWSRLTSDSATQFGTLWMPDGNDIVYTQDDPPYNLYRRSAEGSGEAKPLLQTIVDNEAQDISPDGSTLLYIHNETQGNQDLWTLSLDDEPDPRPWLASPFEENFGTFSPDGRWVAYVTNETGERQVFVTRYPEGDRKVQVSLAGGHRPRWSHDGREIFFRQGISMMAVEIELGERPDVGQPQELFQGVYQYESYRWAYDVAADGRFIMIKAPYEDEPREIQVVLNWFEELEALVPAP
jgi:serine/threonine-protein kinase